MPQEPLIPKIVITALIVLLGAGGAFLYWPASLRRGRVTNRDGVPATGPERPWRRVASGIFLVVSIMFLFGVVLVDVPDHPRAYAAFWAILLGMVIWLLWLAAKDLRYTSLLAIRSREAKRQFAKPAIGTDADPKSP